jgi:hypothetical protein
MKLFLSLLVCIAAPANSPRAQTAARITSVYTELSGGRCKTIKEDKETGSSVKRCPGVGGFRVQVEYDDNRMSLTLIASDNKEYPLDLWNVITPAFSSLGNKAEWRVAARKDGTTPVGLIVRVNAYEQEDPSAPKRKSYLAVAKITRQEVCVTDKIDSSADANEEARRRADRATDKPCLKP